MKQISIAGLEQQLYALHHISAINMVPRNRTFSNLPNGRISSALFYSVSGRCVFSWNGGETEMPKAPLDIFLRFRPYISDPVGKYPVHSAGFPHAGAGKR